MSTGVQITAEELGRIIDNQIDEVNKTNFLGSTYQMDNTGSENFRESDLNDSYDDEFVDVIGMNETGDFIWDNTSIPEKPASLSFNRPSCIQLIEFYDADSVKSHKVWIPDNNMDFKFNAREMQNEQIVSCSQLFRSLLRQNDYQDVSEISYKSNWDINYPQFVSGNEEQAFSLFLKMYFNIYVEDSAAMSLMSFIRPEHVKILSKCHRLLYQSDVLALFSISNDYELCSKVFQYAYDSSLTKELIQYFRDGGSEESLRNLYSADGIRKVLTLAAMHASTNQKSPESVQQQKSKLNSVGDYNVVRSKNFIQSEKIKAFNTDTETDKKRVAVFLKEHNVSENFAVILMQDKKKLELFTELTSARIARKDIRQFLAVLAVTNAVKLIPDNRINIQGFNCFWMSAIAQKCSSNLKIPIEIGRRIAWVSGNDGYKIKDMYLDDFLFRDELHKLLKEDVTVDFLPDGQGIILHHGTLNASLHSYVQLSTSLETACADDKFILESARGILLYNFIKCRKLYESVIKKPVSADAAAIAELPAAELLAIDRVFAYASEHPEYLPIFRSASMRAILFSVQKFVNANAVKSAVNFINMFLAEIGVLKGRSIQKKSGVFSENVPSVYINGDKIPEPFKHLSMSQFVFVIDELSILFKHRSIHLTLTASEKIIIDA